jgi:hypothetical protein
LAPALLVVRWDFAIIPGSHLGRSYLVEAQRNVIDYKFKFGTGNSTGHGAISKDGKALTNSQDFIDDQRRRGHSLIILEKR